MERLPDDLVVTLTEFLSGVNVLMLSHANRRLYLLLSDANVWMPRLGRATKGQPRPRLAMPRCREKMEYTMHKTVLSRPAHVDDPSDHVCRHVFSSFTCHTISIRFCLLPECISWPSGTASGSVEVFCSSNKQLTVSVPVGEWCHLLWTLDSQQETVYFNGKRLGATVSDGLCSIFDVDLRTNFFGFPSEIRTRTKEEDYCFVFHGLLDEFHVRKCVLLEKDIQKAVQTRLYRLPSRPDYADFIGENCLAYGSRVAQVLCTQPHERIGEIVPFSRYSTSTRSSKARKESAEPRWWPRQWLW